jgi:hypothetical protein
LDRIFELLPVIDDRRGSFGRELRDDDVAVSLASAVRGAGASPMAFPGNDVKVMSLRSRSALHRNLDGVVQRFDQIGNLLARHHGSE